MITGRLKTDHYRCPSVSLFGGGQRTLLRELSLGGYWFPGILRERVANFLSLDLG